MSKRLLKGSDPSPKAAVDRGRHSKPAYLILNRRRCLAERNSRREIERDRRGDRQILVSDRGRHVAPCDEVGKGGERDHGLSRGAHGSARRGGAVTIIGECIVGQVARRVAGNLSRGDRAAPAVLSWNLTYHCLGQSLGRLRPSDRAAAGADIDLV